MQTAASGMRPGCRPGCGKQPFVLVIGSDPLANAVQCELLRAEGFDAAEGVSAKEAIANLDGHVPDAVVTGFLLHGAAPDQQAAAVRQVAGRDIPWIVFSGLPEARGFAECHGAWFVPKLSGGSTLQGHLYGLLTVGGRLAA